MPAATELARLSNQSKIQDGTRFQVEAVGGVGITALLVPLTRAVGPVNAKQAGLKQEVSAQSTLALSHYPHRWGFACNLSGEGVRKCGWKTVGDR